MDNESIVKQIRQGNNIKYNMEILYNQNKGIIYNTVKKFAYIDRMTDIDDLMQQAYISMVKAIDGYDRENDTLFISYATKVIKTDIKRYLDNTGRSMRLPVHVQEKIYKYNRLTSYFLAEYNREPTRKEYLVNMEMSERQFESLLKTMQVSSVSSLDAPIEEELTMTDIIPDRKDEMAAAERKIDKERLSVTLWDAVHDVVKDEHTTKVMQKRYKTSKTIKEIGHDMDMKPTEVRTLHDKGIRKLRMSRQIKNIAQDNGIVFDEYTDEEREILLSVGIM
ncbi:MAG: sigma-70 family RNA polymerase sigma factor [Anaerostipes sp.]|nr:sigma-70 family RNA polymerase sigma factor [Anaerostipes sp.]MDD3747502.1 sigma-70 family RNA polymerase sigma factor [Anaerostipes sp.]MDD4371283.1 sigma-70 family RNA polymerase sigma factor [Anaerostipes sp.]